jgi:hypothetical protein
MKRIFANILSQTVSLPIIERSQFAADSTIEALVDFVIFSDTEYVDWYCLDINSALRECLVESDRGVPFRAGVLSGIAASSVPAFIAFRPEVESTAALCKTIEECLRESVQLLDSPESLQKCDCFDSTGMPVILSCARSIKGASQMILVRGLVAGGAVRHVMQLWQEGIVPDAPSQIEYMRRKAREGEMRYVNHSVCFDELVWDAALRRMKLL